MCIQSLLPLLLLGANPLPDGAVARFGDFRLRHEQSPSSTIFSPDGKLLVTGGRDGVLRFWDVATGELTRSWKTDNAQPLWTLLFSRDGKLLLVGHSHGSITIHDAVSGEKKKVFAPALVGGGSYVGVTKLALSEDGKSLISYSQDRTVRVWDQATGRQAKSYQMPPTGNTAAAVTPDAKYHISPAPHGPLGTLVITESATGKEGKQLTSTDPRPAQVHGLTVSPDGKLLAALHYGGLLLIWDLEKGELLAHRRLGFESAQMAFSPDGRLLAFSTGRMLQLFGALSLKELRSVMNLGANYGMPAFSPDGRLLASPNHTEQRVSVWTIVDMKELFPRTGSSSPATILRFLPEGRLAAYDTKTLKVLDIEKGTEVAHLETTFASQNVVADGKRLLWIDAKGRLVRWTPGEKPEETDSALGKHTPNLRGTLSPDGNYFAHYTQTGFQLHNLKTGKATDVSRVDAVRESTIESRAFTPDSKTLLVGYGSGYLRAFDCATGKALWMHSTVLNPTRVGYLFVSADGKNYLTSSEEVKLDELMTQSTRTTYGKLSQRYPMFPRFGEKLVTRTGMALSPDGWLTAVATSDGNIQIFAASNSENEVATIKTGQGEVRVLEFSPDGKRLATSGSDRTIVVWKVQEAWRKLRVSQPLTKDDLPRMWEGLGWYDAGHPHSMMVRLLAEPDKAVPFLKEQFKPRPAPDPKRIQQLIQTLESGSIEHHYHARNQLWDIGEPIREPIKKAMEKEMPREIKDRLRFVLTVMDSKSLSNEDRRKIRSVEVLERIGSKEAVEFLQELAKGPEDRQLTREAKASLARLGR